MADQDRKHRKRRRKPTTQGVLRLEANLTKGQAKRRLEWLFSFYTRNIEGMDGAEFVECMFETLVFLYGDSFEDPEELRRICADTSGNRGALQKIKKRASYFLLLLKQRVRLSTKFNVPVRVQQGTLDMEIVIADGVPVIRPTSRLELSYRNASLSVGCGRPLAETVELSEQRRNKILGKAEDPAECVFFDRAFDRDIWNSLTITVGTILNGYGVPNIRRCSSCRVYYIAAASKKTRLCRRCQSKRNATEWRRRTENREAWAEYERNRRKGINEGGPAAIRDRKRQAGQPAQSG